MKENPCLTLQESIREIEETLNQQLFNIRMNLSLESNHSRHSNGGNINVLDNGKEQQQQTVLNVIYETNNNNNSNGDGNGNNNGDSDNNMVPPEEHVFTSQLDSFEMDEIALQVRSRHNSFAR